MATIILRWSYNRWLPCLRGRQQRRWGEGGGRGVVLGGVVCGRGCNVFSKNYIVPMLYFFYRFFVLRLYFVQFERCFQ